MFWSSVLVLGLVQLCASTPLNSKRWDDLAEKHSWVEIPKGWEFHSAPSPNQLLELRLGLKQDKIDELISTLYKVSDPAHESYGNHLSKEEVDALVAPHPDSVEAVESWLTHHGVNVDDTVSRTAAGEWVTIKVSIAQAEGMLGATYGVYHHAKSSDYVVRTLSYSLPRELHNHIDVITPTTYFGTFKSMKVTSFLQPDIAPIAEEAAALAPVSNAAVPASCSTTITPACLRALYNTTDYVPTSADVNTIGVAGYLNQYANRADLQTFFTKFRPDAVGATYTTIQLNGGGDDQSSPGTEANLDIQYSEAISFPTPNIYYSTGGSPPFNTDSRTPKNTNEPYLDWLNFVLNQTSIPQTFTTSYADDEQTVPQDYAVSVCNLLAQLGVRGSSVLYASGDLGVGGGDCKTNDGTNKVVFQPAFPASCPFVTAVGGTIGINPEVAISFSGGGFSNYFSVPDYQATAVNTFVTGLGTKFSGMYNNTGRAYPDVAAQGLGFQVVIGGKVSSEGGTSASCPTVAAIVSLLNDYRLANGKSSLGFLNPLIYANPDGFNDIKSGSNPGCISSPGFTAGAGWDPVTGLGTPDFLKLQPIVLAAP